METLIAPFVNVTILSVVLFVLLRKPARGYVAQRHQTLKGDLQEVRAELRNAQSALEEYSAKLSAVDAELAVMREQVRQDAESLKSQVLDEGRQAGERIVSDARLASSGLVDELRQQLRADFAEQVLQKAEALLVSRITGEDRARLRQEFSQQAEKIG